MADNEKAKWTRLAALGLVMAGIGPLLILGAGLLFGLDFEGDIAFFLITAAIALSGAFLVWRFGTWGKVAGAVAGLLVGLALFWTAFGLMQPASFFDFLPGLLVLPGALIAIVASIAAVVSGRRGRATARPEGGERLGLRIVAGVVVLGAVVSGALNLFTRPTASAGDAQASVAMKDFRFDEQGYEVAGGSTVFVDNNDPFAHTFTIDELDVDEAFIAGGSKVVQIPDRPGTYVLYCKPHTSDPEDPGEEDMASRITVT
ncbi:MAG TPA: cupredoxin domain-containing protein [Actinomycetota bacterium]|nr:cupredoxin domain-containing protein [Actinomycetota bacterium]